MVPDMENRERNLESVRGPERGVISERFPGTMCSTTYVFQPHCDGLCYMPYIKISDVSSHSVTAYLTFNTAGQTAFREVLFAVIKSPKPLEAHSWVEEEN